MDYKEVDLIQIIKKVINSKQTILKITAIGLITGIIIAFSLPKTYRVDVIISPESGAATNNMAGLANMFGMSGTAMGKDAIDANMFPQIVASTPFLIDMLEIKVKTTNNKEYKLYDYLNTFKSPWWSNIRKLPSSAISLFGRKDETTNNSHSKINNFKLTIEQQGRIGMLRSLIYADIDKKSNMTKISTTMQDPMVAAIVADSAICKLQSYITEYRTKKARQDYEYLLEVSIQRKEDLYNIQEKYAQFMDANKNIISNRTKAESERLQNSLSIALQVYSQTETQVQMAKAKLQEAKPVFAIIEPATVPLNESSPNKKLIILASAFLFLIASIGWILLKDEFINIIKS